MAIGANDFRGRGTVQPLGAVNRSRRYPGQYDVWAGEQPRRLCSS
jgi:hypothetical protein